MDGNGDWIVQQRMFDGDGELVNRLDAVSDTVLVALPAIWNGQRQDVATGLYGTGSQVYDSSSGRFINQASAGTDPNPYRYENGDPVNDGPSAFDTWGSIGFGLIDSTPFGLLYGDDVRAQTNGGYFVGLGAGVAGQILLGNLAAGVVGATNFARVGTLGYQATRAAAYAYEGYAAADTLIGAGMAGYGVFRSAAYGEAFNPLSIVSFAPAIGLATRGRAALQGFRRVDDMLGPNSLGAAQRGSRPLNRVASGGTLNAPIELAGANLRQIQAEIGRGQRILLGSDSVYNIGDQIFETDSVGRLARTRFSINAANFDDAVERTGSVAYSTRLVGRSGRGPGQGDVGFHLLGHQFGGSQYYPNVIPASGGLNRYPVGGYGQLEDLWEQAARNGKQVDVRVDLNYGWFRMRPSTLGVNMMIGREPLFARLANRADSFADPRILNRLRHLIQ